MFDGKKDFIASLQDTVSRKYGKALADTNDLEKYNALAAMVTAKANSLRRATNERFKKADCRRVYYFSLEFLIGRLLYNYLQNLGVLEIVQEGLKEIGSDLDNLVKQELDPGLGNGGLGRLAACFLDSMASEDVPGYGYGLFYRHGLFKQEIENGYQIEKPDDWLVNGYPWAVSNPEKAIKVKFGGKVLWHGKDGNYTYEWAPEEEVLAIPNEIPVIGYTANTVNRLSLFSARQVVEELDLVAFNQGDYSNAFRKRAQIDAITQVLYPSDSHRAGQILRLKQEYFLVSAGIADIVRHYRNNYGDDAWDAFASRVAIHINDTHPALCGPELMRVFLDELGLKWDKAWEIVTNTISYTNHTILPEALEQWPIEMLREVLPRIYMIVEEIDRRYKENFPKNMDSWYDLMAKTSILWDGKAKMANLSIISSYAVNGVSALHSEILKYDTLNSFYQLTPEKFNNKTNGISPRRFLSEANPELAHLITKTIGDGWMRDATELSKLKKQVNNPEFLDQMSLVKRKNKERLAAYILETTGITVSPDSVFDIQVKRMHAYKRQLLNAFKIIDLYNRLLEDPDFDMVPHTFIFAGKAAQSYSFAKTVIKLINSLADVINNDERVGGKIKVVFLKNFNVSLAQMIYPAADISEQISTAGMEASGTGNMKFMFNGAVTLGTLDGANVEILEQVGAENIKIFGLKSEEVSNLRSDHNYNVWTEFTEDTRISKILSQLRDGTFCKNTDEFNEIYDSLMHSNDYFFVLKDFHAYVDAWKDLNDIYKGKNQWQVMSLNNIASAGYFSSDRTIDEYVDDIWHTLRRNKL